MNRREFLESLAIAATAGLPIASRAALAGDSSLYDVPRFGNVSLLHITDCHAQLMPIHFREPDVNIGVA
ncbi:MAG: thiosulfohydrolase SoxB, partial [Bacillota bacterium]